MPGINDHPDAELGVFVFPGGGGGVKQNLDRWYNQFLQPDDKNSTDLAKVKNVEINQLSVILVYLTGTFQKSGK